MQETRWDVQVLNLGTAYAGWMDSVWKLLDEVTRSESLEDGVVSIPVEALRERLRSLRYVCLIDDLALAESRRAFPGRPESEEPDEDLYGLLAGLLDAPLLDEEQPQPRWPTPEDLLPPESRSEILEADLRGARAAAEQEPHHSGGDAGGDGSAAVVVDCYGLYVGSLLGWMEGLGHRGRNARFEEMRQKILSYEEEDGPAVLLSPELISTLHRLVMGRAPRPLRHYLTPDRLPDRIFLKLVLLHEVGHHVYPVHERAAAEVSEAMANWFTYGFLSPGERAVLHEKARTQARAYQMYEGLLALLHPTGPGSPWVAAMPWNLSGGADLVSFLEWAAFDGVLGDADALAGSRHHALESWLAEDASLWSALPDAPQLQPLLRRMLPGQLHPAKVLGWILLSRAIPGSGGELARAMSNLQHAGAGPWRPMPLVWQYAWLNAAWSSRRSLI